MHYKESKQILEKIKKAKKIVINCHRSPDPDSVGSALSLRKWLLSLNKKVTIISSDKVSENLSFLDGFDKITQMNFSEVDFSVYDLFISVDTENLFHVGFNDEEKPEVTIINIDHHYSNRIEGVINLIDSQVSSSCEVLYNFFSDVKFNYDAKVAQMLLTGICTDTGFFQFVNTFPSTLRVSASLREEGADYNEIVFHVMRQNSLDLLRLTGEFLTRLQIDEDHHFVWSAIPYSVYKKYKITDNITGYITNVLLRTIKNTNFGMAIVERSNKNTTMSLRARVAGFDVSLIGHQVGGGGHKDASGGKIQGVPFKDAVEMYLAAARQYGKSNEKSSS
jgi:phosphoesterase RecJ-like protein